MTTVDEKQISKLTQLQQKLLAVDTLDKRLEILNKESTVNEFLAHSKTLSRFIETATTEQEYVLKEIIAIGQGPVVLKLPQESDIYLPHIKQLANSLLPTERFYNIMGGIVGYHLTMLKLLRGQDLGPFRDVIDVKYSAPPLTDIRERTPSVNQAILYALQHLAEIGEVYVVGGAGDRLNLRDAATNEPLPVACLHFQNHTLLHGLVRDAQAREYLHFKLYGNQVITPIAMMTSQEKNNHQHILNICKELDWFGRGEDAFFFFSQPGGPVITTNGDWSLKSPLTITMKPGGHGVLWKLIQDHKALDWFEQHGCQKLLVRQINNPVACTDYGILAFLGFGLEQGKSFGMASCDRLVNRPEGMSALIETRKDNVFEYRISNIEYTEFGKRGIKDTPKEPETEVSRFPANTNVLLADIDAIKEVLPKCPLPGLLVNAKTVAPFIDADWNVTEVPAGRLETTMQNIADFMVDQYDHPLPSEKHRELKTFATYYERSKTLSTTKNSLKDPNQIVGTPEGCFYDVLKNYHELLERHCGWTMPTLASPQQAIRHPTFLTLLHPALGPLFSIAAQKLRRSSMSEGSELEIEGTEILIDNITLSGSLRILCNEALGHTEGSRSIYSNNSGKCSLQHVKISNSGVDYENSGPLWRHDIIRHESLTIILHGNAEFHAENVSFNGNQIIEVHNGERLVAKAGANGGIAFERHSISSPSWYWNYRVDHDEIILSRQEL